MNYYLHILFFCLSFFFGQLVHIPSVHADAADVGHTILQDKFYGGSLKQNSSKKNNSRTSHKKMISLYLENENLIDLINFLASQKEANVVLPMGAHAINPVTTVTLHLEDKVTIEQAWDILYTLLDLAGYSMIAKEDTYTIVKTSKDVAKEPMPLFIVNPDALPDTDKRIRYLYYFSNIKIADEERGDVMSLLNDILPDEKVAKDTLAPAFKKIDAQSNSILIVDKANNIKAAMKVVTALDSIESQEVPEIIQLRYVPADIVDRLFNENLLKTAGDANQARLGIRQPNNATYFKKVRIVPDMRSNRLIVFGRPQAVERVRDFIHKYIDVELESGQSILHVYQLQYLDAKTFAKQLENILKAGKTGGTEQSKGTSSGGGVERMFDQVIIKADAPETISGEQPGGESRGSNNLIIAARNDDYERIKKLIEQLDTPQQQVIIEVLIADLTVQDIASLGANIRNPLGTGLSNNVNFQSAQTSDFLTNTVNNPSTIQADLLRRAFDINGNITSNCDTPGSGTTACFSAAPFFPPGTAMFSFNDAATGQTWGIAQVRKFLDGRKVITQPHIITTNNSPAEIVVLQERLTIDQGSGSAGGTTTQTRKWVPAPIQILITPRISSANTVNLQVTININQFVTSVFTNNNVSTANQITRNVTTNANVQNGSVLALGGLTRIDTAVDRLETPPLLARIPIIGWLFKERTNTINKNNLTVFISPTIIEPRVRGGIGNYTKKQVQLAKGYAREGMLFDNLKDPITRWFFNTQVDAETTVDDFISQDEFVAPTIFDTREQNKTATIAKKDTPAASKNVIIAQPKSQTAPAAQQPAAPAHDQNSAKTTDLKTLVADIENPFKSSKSKA